MTGVERAVYETAEVKELIKDLLENVLRSYLNGLTIDDGITRRGAGFDFNNQLPEKERERIKDALLEWGYELKQITVMDFDLEAEVVRARGQVHIEKRKAEAAEAVAQRQAIEWIEVIVEMMARAREKNQKRLRQRLKRTLNFAASSWIMLKN